VALSNPSPGASLGTPNIVTIRITSEDISPHFSIGNYTFSENAGEARLTVVRGNDTLNLMTVEFATHDDTAKAGLDYTATSGVLEFKGSERTKEIVIPLLNNDRLDGFRQLRIELKDSGVVMGSGLLTIRDNETGVQLNRTK